MYRLSFIPVRQPRGQKTRRATLAARFLLLFFFSQPKGSLSRFLVRFAPQMGGHSAQSLRWLRCSKSTPCMEQESHLNNHRIESAVLINLAGAFVRSVRFLAGSKFVSYRSTDSSPCQASKKSDRSHQYRHIDPERNSIYITDIQAHPLIACRVILAAYLPQARQAGKGAKAGAMPVFESLRLIGQARTRSYQTHLSAQDIQQLR